MPAHGQSEQLTDRNSSRVLAAPGGHSDMASLLGGYQAPAVHQPRQPQPQPQPYQQQVNAVPQMAAGQRVELRTEHTGITVGNVSSRVLAAPGGASDMASIISGGGSAPAAAAVQVLPQPVASVPAQPVAQPQMAAGQRVELRTEHTGITVGNVSSRVLAAPGGASDMASIISGGADCSAADRIAAMKARRMQTLGDATNDPRGTYAPRPF